MPVKPTAKAALVDNSRRSQQSAKLMPAPAATPLTPATTGLGIVRNRPHDRVVRALDDVADVAVDRGTCQVRPGAETPARAGQQDRADLFVVGGVLERGFKFR